MMSTNAGPGVAAWRTVSAASEFFAVRLPNRNVIGGVPWLREKTACGGS